MVSISIGYFEEEALTFAKRHTLSYPNTIIQEDGASCHASDYNKPIFELWQIAKILWPGNSPDLNAIEPYLVVDETTN